MSMMCEMKFVLGLQVHQSPRGVFINQSQYTLDLLKKHGMDGCDSISTPMATAKIDADLQGTSTDQTKYCSMIEGLMYLTASRPDIAFATFVCARYQARLTEKHLKEGVTMIARAHLEKMGDKLVSWSSKKQNCTTMLTVEAEYVSLSACYAQIMWIRTQLLDYGDRYTKIPMYCDSKSAIAISCNPVQHSRTKHINIRYHFIKEHAEQGTIELYFVGIEYQLVDLFTKALPKERFEYLVHRIVEQMECKIVGQLLVDHALSYALTANANVPAVYLQQFWKTVRLVVNANETIRFTVDRKEITYTMDMFRSTLKLPVETSENPFIISATLKFIHPFLKIVGYQGNVDKVSAFFTKYLAQPWKTMFKVFNRCLTSRTSGLDQSKSNSLLWCDFLHYRLEDDYHSIKDDIPLVSVYTTGNVTVKGMLIPDVFLTDDICANPEYKEYEMVFVEVDVPTIHPQPVESTQGTNRTPSAHRTPTPTVVVDDVIQKKKRKQVAGETSSPGNLLKSPSSKRNQVLLQFHLPVMTEKGIRLLKQPY
ncbi:hypothetical protein Tco_0151689 [Tanacetum coccineum]